jgi:hypothetical protein
MRRAWQCRAQTQSAIEPEFEAHTDKVGAVLLDEARLAVEMGKAGRLIASPSRRIPSTFF